MCAKFLVKRRHKTQIALKFEGLWLISAWPDVYRLDFIWLFLDGIRGYNNNVFFGAELLQDQAEVSLAVDSVLVNTREPALDHKHSSLRESVTQLSCARRWCPHIRCKDGDRRRTVSRTACQRRTWNVSVQSNCCGGTRTVGFLLTLPCRRMCPLPFSCIYAWWVSHDCFAVGVSWLKMHVVH